MSKKRSYILKKTWSWKLQGCLSMYDLLVDTRCYRVNNIFIVIYVIQCAHWISLSIFRSSHHSCSMKKSVLRNFTKFTGKHWCQSLFFNKCSPYACNCIKKETLAQVFSCEFHEISENTSGRLLLHFKLYVHGLSKSCLIVLKLFTLVQKGIQTWFK